MFRLSFRNLVTCDKMQPIGSNSKNKLLVILRKFFPNFIPKTNSSSKVKDVAYLQYVLGTHLDEMERGELGAALLLFCSLEQKSLGESFVRK